MTETLHLYYAPDNASLCVRLALLELAMPFKTVLVDRKNKAHKSPEYLAINPNGLIPVLVTPDGPMHETGAILLWLADRQPGFVFPAVGDPERAGALTRLFWLANTLHPTLRMSFYPDQYSDAPGSIAVSCIARLRENLRVLENSAEPWLETDEPSILACYLAPMLRWAALYGSTAARFNLARYPRLSAFASQFELRDAMVLAAQAEGLGPNPISAPQRPNPPEGSAL